MPKILKSLFLFAAASTFAAECYVMPHLASIEKPRTLLKKDCAVVSRAMLDMDYYAQAIGKEAELILEKDGVIAVGRFYYSPTRGYQTYLMAQFAGLNPVNCFVTTSSGPKCGALEWVLAGVAIRDYYLGRK